MAMPARIMTGYSYIDRMSRGPVSSVAAQAQSTDGQPRGLFCALHSPPFGVYCAVYCTAGELGFATDNGAPVVLLPGRHVYNSVQFKFNTREPVDKALIKFETITVVTIPDGTELCRFECECRIFPVETLKNALTTKCDFQKTIIYQPHQKLHRHKTSEKISYRDSDFPSHRLRCRVHYFSSFKFQRLIPNFLVFFVHFHFVLASTPSLKNYHLATLYSGIYPSPQTTYCIWVHSSNFWWITLPTVRATVGRANFSSPAQAPVLEGGQRSSAVILHLSLVT